MAEKEYTRGKGVTPIQEMTTRQLRRYIRERAEEAESRVRSIKDIEDTSKAFQDQLKYVQSFGSGRSGSIKKDTSRIDKETMAMYAYALRDLNMLDTESKYARDTDYRQNRSRYEAFIKGTYNEELGFYEGGMIHSKDEKMREYWSQFLTEKGNVKKSGYTEYKNFVNFIEALDKIKASYGYENIQDIYAEQDSKVDSERIKELLFEVYEQNSNEGFDVKQLAEIFDDRLKEERSRIKAEEEAQRAAAKNKKAMKKAPAPKSKGNKSKQNIGIEQGVKHNGRVREKQTTKKLSV